MTPFTPTIPALVRHVSAEFGANTLLVLGERRVTYGEADAASAALAGELLAQGVGKGTHVGVLMPNGPDWVVAFLAAARIGAVVVALNTFAKPRELRWFLDHADVHTLLMSSNMLGIDLVARVAEARELEPPLPYLRAVRVLPDDGSQAVVDDAFLRALESTVSPADPLVIIYTSGSTAEPKGVVHSHGAAVRHSHTLNTVRVIEETDKLYAPMPFFWVGGLSFALLTVMHAGATLVCEEAFEPGATLELLERERVTLVNGWPHAAKAMAEDPTFPDRDLTAIRGGNLYAILPPRLRPADPELRHNALGMTEAFGPHILDDFNIELPERRRGSFGRSVPGVEHKIVDPGTGARLVAGQLGELCVRGYNVMLGLYKVEREDTFDAEGWYQTGDTGFFDEDGYFYYRGRLGDMIKTAGANVSPREVEVVLETSPVVRHAFVVGVADPARGEVVAAAVVPHDGAVVDLDELLALAARELSSYKVPRRLVVLAAADVPWLESGKIDKRGLARLLEER